MDRLTAHNWTGNVRDLENVLVEAVVRAHGKVILLEEIEKILDMNTSPVSMGFSSYSLLSMEKEHIEKTLLQTCWNRTTAATMLGISLPTLRSKIRKYEIIPPYPQD